MKVFISYSSRDRDIRQYIERELAVHLNALAPNTYTLWSDAGIDIGANWREVIETQMAESDAALLLVSPGFMASEFINNVELTEFFRRKQEAGYILIPVEIRHTPNWGELAQLNFFKTYRTDYGFTRPADRNERLAFEQLYDNDRTTDAQLNTYFTKLAECVHGAFLGRMKKDSSTPLSVATPEPAHTASNMSIEQLKGWANEQNFEALLDALEQLFQGNMHYSYAQMRNTIQFALQNGGLDHQKMQSLLVFLSSSEVKKRVK